MSITVKKPDTYTFTCQHKDGRTNPEAVVALGPNYVWEFFKVVGKISFSLLGGMTVFFGSLLLAVGIVVVAMFKKPQPSLRES